MQAGDKVYYLYTDKHGVPIKFAAIVLALEDDGILIRVGRYDVHTREVSNRSSLRRRCNRARCPVAMKTNSKDRLDHNP